MGIKISTNLIIKDIIYKIWSWWLKWQNQYNRGNISIIYSYQNRGFFFLCYLQKKKKNYTQENDLLAFSFFCVMFPNAWTFMLLVPSQYFNDIKCNFHYKFSSFAIEKPINWINVNSYTYWLQIIFWGRKTSN